MQQPADLLTEFETQKTVYGSFFQRFVALFIDGLILSPLAFIDWYDKTVWKSQLILLLVFVIQVVYKSFFEFKYGATPGKMALKLKVVRKDLFQPGLKEILIRNIFDITFKIVTFVTTLTLFRTTEFLAVTSNAEYQSLYLNQKNVLWIVVAYLILLIIDGIFLIADKKNRALHDLMGDTLVIKSRS
ncbi:MAG: RDD family protein [Bacteroidota bacterium]